MCGIVGFINYDSTVDVARRKWLAQALHVDQLRGKDSTGLAILPKPPVHVGAAIPAIKVYKRAVNATDWLQLTQAEKLIDEASTARLAIGHNRAATQGNSSDDNNAHPFRTDHITMVHNGTLLTRNGLKHYHQVDSASICMQLADTDPSKYVDLLSALNGAFTLVWHNATTDTVYMARNEDRPLILGRAWNNQTLFYASEQWMITGVMPRISNTALDITKDKYYDTLSLPEYELWSFPLDQDEAKHTVEKFSKFVPPYAPPKQTPVPNSYNGYNNAMGGYAGYEDDEIWDNYVPAKDNKKATDLKAVPNQCPYALGDTLYADCWSWEPVKEGAKRGTISGISVDYRNVGFAVSNVTADKQNKLKKELEEWQDYLDALEDEDSNNAQDVFLCGTITQITTVRVSGKAKYTVSLKPRTLTVELLDIGFEDIKEEEDVVPTTSNLPVVVNPPKGGDTEKKPSAPAAGACYKLPDGYGSYQEWVRATSGGCCWCLEPIPATHHEKIKWTNWLIDGEETDMVPCCTKCSAFITEEMM